MPEQPDPLANGSEPNAARVLMRIIRSQTGVIVKEHICRRIIDEIVKPVREQGLAEGRRQRDAEYDVKLGGDGSGTPPVEMVYGYNAGVVEGRRQATEDFWREWALELRYDVAPYATEAEARTAAAEHGLRVVSRLVGPWEPVEPKGSSA